MAGRARDRDDPRPASLHHGPGPVRHHHQHRYRGSGRRDIGGQAGYIGGLRLAGWGHSRYLDSGLLVGTAPAHVGGQHLPVVASPDLRDPVVGPLDRRTAVHPSIPGAWVPGCGGRGTDDALGDARCDGGGLRPNRPCQGTGGAGGAVRPRRCAMPRCRW